jgi:hypothetical protein
MLRAHPAYEGIRERIETRLNDLQVAAEAFNAAIEPLTEIQEASAAELHSSLPPAPDLPKSKIEAFAPDPLFWSRDDWREATEKLIEYRGPVSDQT